MQIGSTISHYKIVEKLGEGGMGVVYKAEDTILDRPVALKFLADRLLNNEEAGARFLREAKAAAALLHPNVCPVYEIAEADGKTFLAMAFLKGETLEDLIARGPLPLADVLDIARQVAAGLQAAHAEGIVHRDIKPANIIISPEGRATIMDFGLARLTEASRLTKVDTAMGTVTYMAPEQAQGIEVDRRADIWSFGVVLYEMLAGQPPFRGEYELALIYSIVNETPESLTKIREDAPDALNKLVSKTLEKSREARYQSVDEMLAELETARASLESPELVSQVPVASQRTRWALIAAASLALAVSSLLYLSTPASPPAPAAPLVIQTAPLTSYLGFEKDPTFSPDGNQVAFSWNSENQADFDIYAKLVGSAGEPLQLTDNTANEDMPSWSPDGKLIAFHRHEATALSVWTVSPLGGPARRLFEISSAQDILDTTMAWSPDSKLLYVPLRASPAEPFSIFAVEISSGDRRQITQPLSGQYGDSTLAVSASGQLAFSRVESFDQNSLRVIDLQTRTETELLRVEGYVDGLAWTKSEDQLFISYGRLLGASLGIERVQLSTAERNRIVGAAYNGGSIALSRDGNRFAYGQTLAEVNLWRYEIGSSSAPRKIASSSSRDESPQISPDGTRIVFTSSRSGVPQIWMANVDGSNSTQLTAFDGPPLGSPSWSPSGDRVVFDSTKNGDWDIWIVGADGGSAVPLAVAEGTDSRPRFSADGQWVYFDSLRSGRVEVWKVSAEGGEPEQVTFNGGANPHESLDGKSIYYARMSERSLYTAPVDGGKERRVMALPGTEGQWHPSREGIYYLDMDPESAETLLMLLPTGQSESRLIRRLEGSTDVTSHPVSVAPDGTWFVYAQSDTSESDLMLIDGLQ